MWDDSFKKYSSVVRNETGGLLHLCPVGQFSLLLLKKSDFIMYILIISLRLYAFALFWKYHACKRNICYKKFKITCGVRSQDTQMVLETRVGKNERKWMGWTMYFWFDGGHTESLLCGHSSQTTQCELFIPYIKITESHCNDQSL